MWHFPFNKLNTGYHMSPVIRQFNCILNEWSKYNSIKHSTSLKNEETLFLTKGINNSGIKSG